MKTAVKITALTVLAGGITAVAAILAMRGIAEYAERCDQQEYMYGENLN